MLFASLEFIFFFLPIVFALYLAAGYAGRFARRACLLAASLFFYGWWNPKFLLLLGASVCFNFMVGSLLVRLRSDENRQKLTTSIFVLGLCANLGLIVHYKYFDFFAASVCDLIGCGYTSGEFFLPLGISFFTFTQIAYLVDMRQGAPAEKNFLDYALFVTYFPHLIAGPFLNHREMCPQFASLQASKINFQACAVGLFIFSVGLSKKVIYADNVAAYVQPAFAAASASPLIGFYDAWKGALAYTMQLYFDFSGYSDMAIGLSLLFFIKLPINFFSPFKTPSIIDFWKAWHITLSRFIQDYVFTPMVKNVVAPRLAARGIKRLRSFHIALPVLLSMTICGLWHGANWTYVLFGFYHGAMLVVNHLWRDLGAGFKKRWARYATAGRVAAWAMTFVLIVISFVIFRAPNLAVAEVMLRSMFQIPELSQLLALSHEGYFILFLLLVCFLAPNLYQVTSGYTPTLKYVEPNLVFRGDGYLKWGPSFGWANIGAAAAAASIVVMILSETSVEFLYFQF